MPHLSLVGCSAAEGTAGPGAEAQACLARSGNGIRTAPCSTTDTNQRWFVADSVAHLGGVDIYSYVNYNYVDGNEDTHELRFIDGPCRAWFLQNVNK
ncbi:hypothetical protein [Streptomyces sp. NPDC088180]|uniref:hypothetical protein n=1 Tax=Streptomyces sp. NPDC088180 TaxID=3365837 RepID=UPI0037F631DB